MSTVAGLRLVSALNGGSLTAANLTTAITPPQGLAGWKSALLSPVQRSYLANDKTARSVWMQSSKAAEEFMLNGDAVRELLRNPEAVTELMDNNTALDAFWKSRAARFELWTNDAAIDKVDKSATALTRALACADLQTTQVIVNTDFNFGRILVLGITLGNNAVTYTFTGRRALSKAGRITAISNSNGQAYFHFALDGVGRCTQSCRLQYMKIE